MRDRCVGLAILIAAVMLAGAVNSSAQEPDPAEMSLEQLLDMELTIASKTGTTAREAPGIVTLVTAEEIEASGARDLIDILRLVPGFDFGVDVQGVVGLGVRGSWGHEGKILKGLTSGVGVYDALGEDFEFLQPYDNYHAPYPDTTREYGLRISYSVR